MIRILATLTALFALVAAAPSFADSGSITPSVIPPAASTKVLKSTLFPLLSDGTQAHFLKDGLIDSTKDLAAILQSLVPSSPGVPTNATLILHVLQWKSHDHSAVAIDQWYVYDPKQPEAPWYVGMDGASWTGRPALSGDKALVFVYLHLRAEDGTDPEAVGGTQAAYSIAVTKAVPTPLADVKAAAVLFNIPLIGSLPAVSAQEVKGTPQPQEPDYIGATGYYLINTAYAASSIVITLEPSSSVDTTPKNAATTSTVTHTYSDESKTFWDISAAYPVVNYTDLKVDQTSNTLVPKTVSRQSLYGCADLYIPTIEPAYIGKNYLPHVFVGLPIQGEVLRHIMGGVSEHTPYGDFFYGVVCDTENQNANGSRKTIWKGTFGIKFSIKEAQTLLGSGQSN